MVKTWFRDWLCNMWIECTREMNVPWDFYAWQTYMLLLLLRVQRREVMNKRIVSCSRLLKVHLMSQGKLWDKTRCTPIYFVSQMSGFNLINIVGNDSQVTLLVRKYLHRLSSAYRLKRWIKKNITRSYLFIYTLILINY